MFVDNQPVYLTSIACLHSTSLCCDAAVRHADGGWERGGAIFLWATLRQTPPHRLGLSHWSSFIQARNPREHVQDFFTAGRSALKQIPALHLQTGGVPATRTLVCSLALLDSAQQGKALFSALLWFYYKTADDQMWTKRPMREVRRPTELQPIHFPLKKDRKNKGREEDGSRK